jgi:hypothetical protein
MIEAWQAGAGILASAVIVGGGAVAVVRHLLKADFVSKAQHEALDRRVDNVEKHLVALPSAGEVRDLTGRLARVETGVAVAQTTIEGVNAGLKRVESLVRVLVDQGLRKSE